MLKYKKHTDADRLRYMHMIEDGRSVGSIHDEFGINSDMLSVLWQKYQLYGAGAIKRVKNLHTAPSTKKRIVCDIEENHITLAAASLKYGPSVKTIEGWLYAVRRHGMGILEQEKKRGRPPGMGRPKKNSRPLSEVEKLRIEVEHLRTENALLKKVRALVEERNACLREIGHGPSKG